MPESKRSHAFALTPQFIEKIHDKLVLIRFPDSEPVGTARDRAKIESAAYGPFQSAFERDIFPTLNEKAAALFHSLIANHPFENGCKRTAIVATDLFLTANYRILAPGPDEMRRLATDTASYKGRGQTQQEILEQIRNTLEPIIVPFSSLVWSRHLSLAWTLVQMARTIRQDSLNQTQPGGRKS